MSVREYAVLYLNPKAGAGGTVVGGGNVVLTAGQHRLDGTEHLAAADTTTLDASTTAHGLLPKLPGDVGQVFRGDGTYGSGVATPVDHGSMGAAETLNAAAGDWHRGTLDADCTITVSGFTVDEGLVLLVSVTQDGTGGWAITWDADVAFAGSDQPDQAAGAVTWFALWSDEGDGTIYGAVVGGAGEPTADAHIADTTDAHDASAVSVADAGGLYAANDVEAALAEIGAHPGDATDAHDASAISVADAGGYFTATDVEAALAEIAADVASLPAGTTGGGDHEHMVELFNGDGSTAAFEIACEPESAEQVYAFVGGSWTAVTVSGAMSTTVTFGSAPGSGTGNVVIQYPAVAA